MPAYEAGFLRTTSLTKRLHVSQAAFLTRTAKQSAAIARMPTTTTTTTTTTTSSYSTGRGGTATTTTNVGARQPEVRDHAYNPHTDGTIQTTHDHPRPHEVGYGLGEDEETHAHHEHFEHVTHWGLPDKQEDILFYCWAIPSWCFEIAAGVLGSYFNTSDHRFIPCASVFLFLSWAAWWQTAVQMMQRASWVRDEGNLKDRRRYLHLAVRLNRLMVPTAVISFCVFIVAYARRHDTHDLANWLLFLIIFIANTVCSVMNAYNNITWESDRLEYEEGNSPYGNTMLAIIGIPTKPRKDVEYEK